MNSSHICLACRRRISRVQLRKPAQWHLRATFISLARNPRTTTDEKPGDDLLDLENNADSVEKGYAAVPDRRKRVPPLGRNNTADQLEALFEESLTPPTFPGISPSPAKFLESYKKAETLKGMLEDDNCSAVLSWHYFLEHFGPEAWRRGAIDRETLPTHTRNRYYNGYGKALMSRIVQAKDEDPSSNTLPTFTEVSKVFSQLGILHGRDWASLMFSLIGKILAENRASPKDLVLHQNLLSDLVGSWNVVLRQIGKHQEYPTDNSTVLDWAHMPILASKSIVQICANRGLLGAFGMLVPTFSSRHLTYIPLISAATFILLKKECLSNESVSKTLAENASPLASALALFVALRLFQLKALPQPPGSEAQYIVNFVKKNWDEMKNVVSEDDIPVVRNKNLTQRSSTPHHFDSSFVHRSLRDALARRDARQVDLLWSDTVKYPVQTSAPIESEQSTSRPSRGTLSASICNYFILVYMSLRQPNRAIDVWNHMIGNGLPPNLSTWDSMMSGCKIARNPEALEDIWAKMRASQIQPDVVCWTTRISGLIECNKIEQSIQALDEMGRIWLAASREKYGNKTIEELKNLDEAHGAVKPNIATINAVIAGLLRRRRLDAAHRILGWAAKFGIRPDIVTYNTLLRSLIREGQTKNAMGLLQKMQEDGLQADVATFTTILDETFRRSEDHTPNEQKEILASVFSEMEAVGVKANLHTYGKIVYQLLQSKKSDMTAVNAVLERMGREDLQPNTYIYTILVEYYFSREPPDIDAVRALIERAKLQVGSVDNIFWDRVIEGYARAGDTSSALRILGKISGASNRISWVTMQTLLTALAQNEEWDVARNLVRNAKADSGGPLPQEARGKEGQHRFWRLVAELDLLHA